MASLFLAEPYLTSASQLVASSNATGMLTRAVATKYGPARLVVEGTYSGSVERDYLARIRVGGAIGVATFDWSGDGGSTWTTGVTTATTPVTLDNGVTIRWEDVGTTTPQLVAADTWRWQALLGYGVHRLLDGKRDTEARSTTQAGAGSMTWDLIARLSSPQIVTAAILGDHNFSSATTVRLQASTNNFAATPLDLTWPWTVGTMARQVTSAENTTPYAYWRIRATEAVLAPGSRNAAINDWSNQGYARASTLYVGTSFQPSRQFLDGFTEELIRLGWTGDADALSRGPVGVTGLQHAWNLRYNSLLQKTSPAGDVEEFKRLWAIVNNTTSRQATPFYWIPDTIVYPTAYLVQWENNLSFEHRFDAKYAAPTRLTEVIRRAP